MDLSSDEYLPSDEERSAVSSEEGSEAEWKPEGRGAPDGYMSPSGYDEPRSDLDLYGAYVWVKPYGRKIAIWFRKEHVYDTKWAKVSAQREESRNKGDLNLTWHHTDLFKNGLCFMQLVPTLPHSKISHIGGVAISKGK